MAYVRADSPLGALGYSMGHYCVCESGRSPFCAQPRPHTVRIELAGSCTAHLLRSTLARTRFEELLCLATVQRLCDVGLPDGGIHHHM